MALVDTLLSLVKATKPATTGAGDAGEVAELTSVRQVALYSLKLLCKLLGMRHPEAFTQVMIH